MESQLKQIWGKILDLDVEEIDTEENLFELGGDSVKAILIIGEAASHQINFDIETLYAYPTIAALSGYLSSIENVQGNPKPDVLKDIEGETSNIFIAPSLEEIGFTADQVSRVAPTDQDQDSFFDTIAEGGSGGVLAFVYEVEGDNLEQRLQHAMNVVTAKNPALRTTFVNVKGTYYQILLKERPPRLICTSMLLDKYVKEVKERKIRPKDPAIQCALVNDSGKHYFVFSILHAFFDSLSRKFWEQDFLDALRDPVLFEQQQPERVWYGDFITHRQKTLDKSSTDEFWKKYLDGTCLETIHPGIPEHSLPFDGVLHGSLPSSLVKGRQIHLATAVMTAWSLALMNLSGQRDVAFTIIVSGRLYPYKGIDRMIGLLIRDRVLRLQITDKTADVDSLLQSVQRDLVSTGREEHSKVTGTYPCGPEFDGRPCAQTYLNLKSGASNIGPQVYDRLTVIPRRDLEAAPFDTKYAIYLEMEPREDKSLFQMNYHSYLIDHERAKGLFMNFVEILKAIAGTNDAKISELIK